MKKLSLYSTIIALLMFLSCNEHGESESGNRESKDSQKIENKKDLGFELPEKIYVGYNVEWINGGYFSTTTGTSLNLLEHKREGSYYIHKEEGDKVVSGRNVYYNTSSKIKFDSFNNPTKIKEIDFSQDSRLENADRARSRSFKISNLGVRMVKNSRGEVNNIHAKVEGHNVCDYVIQFGGENTSCTEQSRLIININLKP